MLITSSDSIVRSLVLLGCKHIKQTDFDLTGEVTNFEGFVLLPNQQHHRARCAMIRGRYGTDTILAYVRLLKDEKEEACFWVPDALRVQIGNRTLECGITPEQTLNLSKR